MLFARCLAGFIIGIVTCTSVAIGQVDKLCPDGADRVWVDCNCNGIDEPGEWWCPDLVPCEGGGCTTNVKAWQIGNCPADPTWNLGSCPTDPYKVLVGRDVDILAETIEPNPDGVHTFVIYELNYLPGDLTGICQPGDPVAVLPQAGETDGTVLDGKVYWTAAGPNNLLLIPLEEVGLRVEAHIDWHECGLPCGQSGGSCCPGHVDIIAEDRSDQDVDGDGIPGDEECLVFGGIYDPDKYDTDGDGCSDGGEDFDGDGLSNLDEYFYGTDPADCDTDNDGVNDRDEIDQVSDPNDSSDYEPAPDCAICDLTLTVGDPSSSHSELYELTLGPYTLNSSGAVGGYGEVVARTAQIKRSRDDSLLLEGRIEHLGSMGAIPDLDGYVRISSTCPMCLVHDDFGFRLLEEDDPFYDPDRWQYYFSYNGGGVTWLEDRWWVCDDNSARTVQVGIRPLCRGDINGDDAVNGVDIATLLGDWGSADWCSDLNEDGVVNALDLGTMLAAYSNCRPSCPPRVPFTCPPHPFDDTWSDDGHAAILSTCVVGDDDCQNLDKATCEVLGGTWFFGALCAEEGCAQGACCSPSGLCTMEMELDCQAAGGTYQGDYTACCDVTCDPPDGGEP